MNIQGLDYNTQRKALQLPEYGREIQKMVEVATGLPTSEERLKCAKTIVKLMESKVPQIRENADYKQTLWDHLYLMSNKQLDIEWPYDVSQAENLYCKPQPLKLPQSHIGLRHYGRLVAELAERLKQMPMGKERDELARLTANQMKRDLALWGHGMVDDERVADDMARMTDGAIQLDLNKMNLPKVVNDDSMQANGNKKARKRK